MKFVEEGLEGLGGEVLGRGDCLADLLGVLFYFGQGGFLNEGEGTMEESFDFI